MGGFVRYEGPNGGGRPAAFRERLVNVAMRVEGVETVGQRDYAYGTDLSTGAAARMVLSSYRGQGQGAREIAERAADGVMIGIGCEPTRSGSLEVGRFYLPAPGAQVIATGLVRISPPRLTGSKGFWHQSLQWLDTASAVKVGSPEEFNDAVTLCLADGGTPGHGVVVRGWNRDTPSSAPVAFSVPMLGDRATGRTEPGGSLDALEDRQVFLHGPQTKASGRALLARVRDTLADGGPMEWEVMPCLTAEFHSKAAEDAAYQPFKDPSSAYTVRPDKGSAESEPRQTGFLPSLLVVAVQENGRVYPRLATPIRQGYPVSVERVATESCDPGAVPVTWSGTQAEDPLFAAALRSFASDMRMMSSETVSNTRLP